MQRKVIKMLINVGLLAVMTPASAQLFDNIAGVDNNNSSVQSQSKVTVLPIGHQQKEVTDLAAYIDGLQTLSGDFDQIVFSSRREQISKGTFRLKRPGKFDWVYSSPNEQRIISDGSKVYHYDKDLEQISIRPRNELAGDTAMNLLVGNQKLLQSFSVTTEPLANVPERVRSDEAGLTFFKLKPKGGNNEIDQVWLVSHNGELTAVYVDTGAGQQSLIILRNVKRNQNIDDKSFHFTPPAGVDVIGG